MDAAHLDASIRQTQKALQATEVNARASSEDSQQDLTLKRKLLRQLEEQQCISDRTVQSEKGVFDTSTAVKLPIFYVTDRAQSPSDQNELFGSQRSENGLSFGSVDVSIIEIGTMRTSLIPGTKRIGAKGVKRQGQVAAGERLTQEMLFERISTERAKLPPNTPLRVLLFVHGYDVTFGEAAVGAAKLASSMQVPLVPLMYSWPSQGNAVGYWHDEDTIPGSVLRFTPFLASLLNGPADEVIIVCHSMGGRIILRAIGELARRGAALSKLGKIAFAAPDVGIDEFSQEWPSLQSLQNSHWTLYASSGDYALRLSKIVHAYKRVGESDQGFCFFTDMDTIDASSTTTVFRTLGHSYVTESPVVAADIGDWVAQDLPPASRGLERKAQANDIYWRFP